MVSNKTNTLALHTIQKNMLGKSAVEDSSKKENLLFNYTVLQKVSKLANITNPNDNIIKRMGLHWTSWKFKLISDNLESVEDFLNDKISLEDFESKSNVDFLNSFFHKGKSSEEIIQIFTKFEKSQKIKIDIQTALLNDDLVNEDLHDLKSQIMFIICDRQRKAESE